MNMKKPSIFRLVSQIIVTIILSFGVVCTIVFLKLSRVDPAYPHHQLNTPLAIVIANKTLTGPIKSFETLRFPSQFEDVMLEGWFVKHPSSNQVVILTHGYNSSKKEPALIKMAWVFFKQGFNVFLYDLQNHGNSSSINGRTALGSREYYDVLGAKQACINLGFSSNNILYYGLSLGAAATLIAAQYDSDIKTIISHGSFSDPALIIKEEFKRENIPSFLYYGSKLIANYLFQFPIGLKTPLDLDKTTLSKLIMIHSKHDNRVGFHHSQRLIENAQKNDISTHFLILDSQEHVDVVFKYENEFKQFYDLALH